MTKNNKTRTLARAACAIGLGLAVAAGSPTAALAEYLGFPDVNPTDWYAGTVEWATDNDVVHGSNGYWLPAGVVDRGTAATILYNFSGAEAPAEGATFSDADTFGWAADGIAWAQDMGVFNGYDGDYGAFGAWDTLTREQAATVLYNMFGNGENTGSLALDAFDDSQDVSLWARAGVAWAAHYKIMGQGGSISPQSTCTRAEFVTMLMRISDLSAVGDDDEKPGDDQKPGTGDEQKPGSGDEPGEGEEKPQEPTGSYDLNDGTWTLKGTVDAKNGYYNNVAFYGHPAGFVDDGVSTVKAQTMLYNADLATDVASVTNDDGVSLKQGVDFDVSRTFNESNGTITTKVTGKNGSTGTLTTTENVHQASALVCAPMYCNIWGSSVPMRFNDGHLHMLYRLMPTVTTSGWTLYNWAQMSGQCTGVIDKDNNTFYYVKDHDDRVNGKTVDSLVCSWFEGTRPESGTVLEEGRDGQFAAEHYFIPLPTVNDLVTDNCGYDKCPYNGHHDFSIADQRKYCGITSLHGPSGMFMASVHNGNYADPSRPIYVLPVSLTD